MRKHLRLLPFVLPGLSLYAVLFLYPTISALYYSLTNWDGLSPSYQFVGLQNYQKVSEDIIFRKAMGNNVKFMLTVVLVQTVVSLLLALQIYKTTKWNVFLRALFFLPTILSSVSVGFIWTFIYDSNLGAVNLMLQNIGLGGVAQNWLGDPKIAIFSIAAVQAWAHIGQMAVLFIAGLLSIPKELKEAAILDGASQIRLFFRIIWPLLAPAAALVVSYTTIQSFKAFDLVFTMTGGGPNYSTEILSTYIYSSAFLNYTFGKAATASVYFMILIAVITFVQFKLLRTDRVSY
ncbi:MULTISPECIES: carbohydrate ABC transporter permease [Paenibacillus]|jgi:raffinose/stachyose/melibiose transport system permease protein|uniref:Carbohydrate ABC transporter membrane protein 1, CUT1 family (TC 3.A.1.1.-) n=1 Tax=Paenibacillus barengoltzii J12 TaxID=935846 RepID=A0ABY1LTN6_9BACL|nr:MULTISPECIES: sugar ABC transporter permease [Paenibacillus]MEC2343272.1 sugar ABC transporter permease [Paenibacillus barengoltzii]SME95519.1 carbohydrate ABC transporter membrane protein 1, CUT1 family (TC 3.A.1.1.-) [Paenibacillus barengoltzii]SME96629.1 carbohydrate ABC transporter membrane protein 1, CUT1 family (TC 3.A.1.1.-) [Paenibacillus barengoltzii J12]